MNSFYSVRPRGRKRGPSSLAEFLRPLGPRFRGDERRLVQWRAVQLRWVMHWPPAALNLPQNWSASPADANGPTTAR